MKKIFLALFVLALGMSACINVDEGIVPVITNSGYTLKISGGTTKSDSTIFTVGDIATVEVLNKDNKKVAIEVDFGSGPSVEGETVAYKYSQSGTYKITAKVKNLTPEVKLNANLVVKKKPVDPLKGESVLLVLDSSYVNGVNTVTYGLRLDISNLDNSPIFVEASVPGKEWLVYTNATEIITINGFQYVKWKVVCANGVIRAGWYQYQTVNGVKSKIWAITSTSKYWNVGLPEFTVYNGTTYVLGTAPVNDKVFTLKLEGVTFNNDTNRVSLNSAITAKVTDEAGALNLADYDFGNGVKAVNVNTASSSYATPGKYKVTATIKSVTPNKVLTTWVVVLKTIVVTPTYILKVNNETVANGTVIKINEGSSLMFKILNKDGVIISSKFTPSGSAPVIADSKTIVYGAAGTFDMSIETQNDNTTFAVKIEVTKVGVPVYTLKVNNETVANGTVIKINEGNSLAFKILNKDGVIISSKFTPSGSAPVIAESKTIVYGTAGTFDMSIETQNDATTFNVKVEVTKVGVPVYTLKVNNVAVTSSAIKTTVGTSLSFAVVNESGVANSAVWSMGEGSSSASNGKSYAYANAGTYQVSATVGTQIMKVTIVVAEVAVQVYTLKVNNLVVTNSSTVKTNAGTSMYFKTVNNTGVSVLAKYDFGDNSSETTDIAAKIYQVAGTYKVTSTYENSVTTVYIEVAAVVVPDVYSIKINGTVTNGTVTLVENTTTTIKVVNESGVSFTAKFDLGNGIKVETDNASTTYVAGNYLISAVINGQTITKNIVVSPSTIYIPKPEAIVIISSSVTGEVITAVLGLRCDAIPNISLTKDTYAAGETPGVNWKDYKLTETVLIDGIRYFKFNITTGAGKFRMSWVQAKDGVAELYKGIWAYDLASNYWNVSEGLFLFNLTIDGSKAKLAK